MEMDQQKLRERDRRARRTVSDRLRVFYGTLRSGFEADAEEFFRRVTEKQTANQDSFGSRS